MKRIYTDAQLVDKVSRSKSLTDTLKMFGLPTGGGSYTSMRRRIDKLGIDTSHWTGQSWRRGKDAITDSRVLTKHSRDNIFSKESPYNRAYVRKLVRDNELIPYNCSICGIGDTWNGRPLTLQLDHINGVNNDNRLTNLRWLCPNCHSQTETFCSKNRTSTPSISDDMILRTYRETRDIATTMKLLRLRNYQRVYRLLILHGHVDQLSVESQRRER